MADTHFSGVDTTTLKISGTKVLGAQAGAVVSLANANGTGNDALEDVTGTPTQTLINNNFRDVTDKIEEILVVLRAHGIINT